MSWQEVVSITVVLLGLGAGAFLVVQRPSFWIEFGQRLGKALRPLAWKSISKRMPPEQEAAWRQAERRGQGDEWLRGRLRRQSRVLDFSSRAHNDDSLPHTKQAAAVQVRALRASGSPRSDHFTSATVNLEASQS